MDEVSDMPLEMQAKLLRVLQERTVRPVGSDHELPFSARVVTATNRHLEDEVAARRFREDLFHRINVVAIRVPPLRERIDDILPLAYAMIQRCAARISKPVRGLTAPTARLLLEYDWPGNVRELENCIERAVALCRLDQITIEDLPEKLHLSCASRFVVPSAAREELVTLAEMQLRYMRKILDMSRGNKVSHRAFSASIGGRSRIGSRTREPRTMMTTARDLRKTRRLVAAPCENVEKGTSARRMEDESPWRTPVVSTPRRRLSNKEQSPRRRASVGMFARSYARTRRRMRLDFGCSSAGHGEWHVACCASARRRPTMRLKREAYEPAVLPAATHRASDRDICDSYLYLLGRLLVLRQEHFDLTSGAVWNGWITAVRRTSTSRQRSVDRGRRRTHDPHVRRSPGATYDQFGICGARRS
jgi:hypothetical protein